MDQTVTSWISAIEEIEHFFSETGFAYFKFDVQHLNFPDITFK